MSFAGGCSGLNGVSGKKLDHWKNHGLFDVSSQPRFVEQYYLES